MNDEQWMMDVGCRMYTKLSATMIRIEGGQWQALKR